MRKLDIKLGLLPAPSDELDVSALLSESSKDPKELICVCLLIMITIIIDNDNYYH